MQDPGRASTRKESWANVVKKAPYSFQQSQFATQRILDRILFCAPVRVLVVPTGSDLSGRDAATLSAKFGETRCPRWAEERGVQVCGL